MKKIPENYFLVLKALTPLVIICLLFIFLGKLAFEKISQIQDQIAAEEQKQKVFTEKLDLLRSVATTGIADSNEAANALPEGNPSLTVVSQLKKLALDNGLILTAIKSSSLTSEKKDVKTVQIEFNIEGAKTEVRKFLQGINTIAPITVISKIKLSEDTGLFAGDVAVDSFFAELPTKLPDTIEEFEGLSEDDKKTLTMVRSLVQPVFISLPPPSGDVKADPFK